MSAKLIWITPEAESVIAYCARVSSDNQDNPDYQKLLTYCLAHGHWSVFEMASMCLEITTTRMVSAQIMRHRSFSFQEFSQRYAEVMALHVAAARRQDPKNRQASVDDVSLDICEWWDNAQYHLHKHILTVYKKALAAGIAKECARAILPMSTETRLYMSGTIRSWIHYLQTRLDKGTQFEHRAIARKIAQIFVEQLPTIASAANIHI